MPNTEKIDLDNIRLTDVIDPKTIQNIQDAFAKATGMAALTVDLNSDITKLSNPTDFCINLTRGSTEGYKRCNECDLHGGNEAANTQKPSVYYCHAGLMDFAAPIMVNGRQVGSMIGGQVLPEEPDLNKFRQIAREIGVDEEEYLYALSKIKRMPKEQIEAAANLLFVISNTLSTIGYQKIMFASHVSELVDAYQKLYEKVETAKKCTNATTGHIGDLREKFVELQQSSDESSSNVHKTGSVIQYIKEVARKTKILGVNASIVAGREGKAGKSFEVIADEMRALAENNATKTDEIEEVLMDIAKSISVIQNNISETFDELDSDTQVVSELDQNIREISEIAEELNHLCNQLS